ncbi:MAG: FAD:protein FMN transferase [Flavobacteriales bacterium]|nr:FAD:protein FMN transferase [Flavobacteriales bacterium]
MKTRFLLFAVTLVLLFGCGDSVEKKQATGFTQGTTYKVVYYSNGADLQYQIDSLLLSFDRVLSTYQQSSYISKWNRNEHNEQEQPQLFKTQLKRAIELNKLTQGTFDITVSPLMEYWFTNNWESTKIDSATVDSLMKNVGMKFVVMKNGNYIKTNPNVRLDVNAVAQGFSVDVLSLYLQSQGIFNYLVEVGGEVRVNGTKPNEEPWKVGIDRPSDDGNLEHELALTVELKNRSLATSGNYRKFVEIDGQKFGHSLNPQTGYPAKTDILSATIIADDCLTADALATACMVMGFEKAKKFVEATPEVDAVFIYTDSEGVKTWRSKRSIQ